MLVCIHPLVLRPVSNQREFRLIVWCHSVRWENGASCFHNQLQLQWPQHAGVGVYTHATLFTFQHKSMSIANLAFLVDSVQNFSQSTDTREKVSVFVKKKLSFFF